MGLDMGLATRIGGAVEEITYWRKQPDLHGFIVDNFLDGVDECQEVELSVSDIDEIIEAVKNDNLKKDHTGFFFGTHDYSKEMKDQTILSFEKAREMVKNNQKVFYWSSW